MVPKESYEHNMCQEKQPKRKHNKKTSVARANIGRL